MPPLTNYSDHTQAQLLMHPSRVSEIDAILQACYNMVAGANEVLRDPALPVNDFVLDFFETYCQPALGEETPPPFLEQFSELALELQKIADERAMLIAEITEVIVTSPSALQANFYMNRLKLTFKLLADLSVECTTFLNRSENVPEFLSELLVQFPQLQDASEFDIKLLSACVAADIFWTSLNLLPGSTAILLQVIVDLTGWPMPSLPYLETLEGYDYSQNEGNIDREQDDEPDRMTAPPADNEHLTKLSHPQIAILHHINEWPITDNNANDTARRYGQTSGPKLKQTYDDLTSELVRTGEGKYRVKDYRQIEHLILEPYKTQYDKELTKTLKNNEK